MKGYKKKTGKDLLEHPLMDQLQSCNSPADILSVLRGQVQQSTSGIDKWTKWLIPTVNVLYAFSGAIGEGVGLVSITRTILLRSDILYLGILTCESDFRWCWGPPFGIDRPESLYSNHSDTGLSQAAKDVVASRDTLIDIFDRIESFFGRLETYTKVPTTHAMRDIIVKIMVEVLGVFGIVTKEIKQNLASKPNPKAAFLIAYRHPEKYLKKLVGRRDIEDALSRLDKLTREEFQAAIAQVLQVTHDVDEGVKNVCEKVDGVDTKVDSVDAKVQGISDNVNVAVEGTLRTFTTQNGIINPYD